MGLHETKKFLHNIKITTKLYNNHHSKLSEIKLNGSPTTMELKKPHPSRPLGGAEMPKGLVPYPHLLDKNSGGISQEGVVPAQTRLPSTWFKCQEDKAP